MNELQQETSPYLLQHANNPVHWKAWNTTVLAKAKAENKLIIISIGYSACHWCHVMEHESFEDEAVAQVMNAHFVSIKIDREERPDLDAIYMKALQIMTQQGGWPLNILALPDGRPVWGATYVPKETWIETLKQLQDLYQENPGTMQKYADKLQQGMQSIEILKTSSKNTFDKTKIDVLIKNWQGYFDWEYGGMASSPKFMMPVNYKFLMQYGHQKQDKKILDYVNLTLTKMAFGGLFDTVGGGFSRYSVDRKWHVPHFEKMLYDNAQLVSLYSEAYRLEANELYKEVVFKTLNFVIKQWLTPKAGFYAAFDADSLDENQVLKEGAFYIWTKNDLQAILKDDFDLFAEVFNCNDFGHWEDGDYVLIQNKDLAEIAHENQITLAILQVKKQGWEQLLYQERSKRNMPNLDYKCITSWNALMLKGFIEAYKTFGDKNHLEIALKNAHFIMTYLWHEETYLWHQFTNEKASINGFLEDYTLVVEAFMALYEITFEEKWLERAKKLTDYTLTHFYNAENAFFAFNNNSDEALFSKHYETEDNVIPASNSIMAGNLFQLAVYFNELKYSEIATKMLDIILPEIQYASSYSNWLFVYHKYVLHPKELAICGKNALDFAYKMQQKYLPNLVFAGSEEPSNLLFLNNRFVPNQTTFYICENQSCQLPETDFELVLKQLK